MVSRYAIGVGGLAAIVISACAPAVSTPQHVNTQPSYDFRSASWKTTTFSEEKKAHGKDFSSVQAVYISIIDSLVKARGFSVFGQQDSLNLASYLAEVSKQESRLYGGDLAEPGPLQPFKILDKQSLERAIETYLSRRGISPEEATSFSPYNVQSGDTISGLASRYTDPEEAAKRIVEKNGLSIIVGGERYKVYNLKAGERILLPNMPSK